MDLNEVKRMEFTLAFDGGAVDEEVISALLLSTDYEISKTFLEQLLDLSNVPISTFDLETEILSHSESLKNESLVFPIGTLLFFFNDVPEKVTKMPLKKKKKN